MRRALIGNALQIEFNLDMCFEEREKPDYPAQRKNSRSKDESQKTWQPKNYWGFLMHSD